MKQALLAAAVLAAGSPAFAATTTFTDAAMTIGNYSLTTYANPGFVTQVVQAPGLGGGTSLETTYTKVGATTLSPRFQALKNSFVFDPTTQGEITSISVSLDELAALTYDGGPVRASGFMPLRLLAEQDGKVYEAFNAGSVPLSFGSFLHLSWSGLTAADFFYFDPAQPYAARTLNGLDFGGNAIKFGFETTPFGVLVNGGPAPGTTISTMRVDNFSVAVDSVSVPEPATWAMLILGFGGIGVVLRRRRIAAFAPC